MKNLVRIFLLLIIVGAAIGIHSSCSDENDCSMAGRPMMYCTFKTNDPDNDNAVLNDTLDSLTVRAMGTDSIILNNEKDVHTVMLPLRYTSDSTVFIFQYNPVRNPEDVDTVYIVQENTSLFSVYGMRLHDETKHHQCCIRQQEKQYGENNVYRITK